jgi:hypothetical protein
MATARSRSAKQRFENAVRFSTALNEMLSALSILAQLSPDQERLIMRLTHTFMLLVTVGASDAFATERCEEVRAWPLSAKGKAVPPNRASFREKLYALRPASVPADAWTARVDDAYELYYKARTLWIHGAGLPGAVRDRPGDLSLFDQDSDGRCWVNRNLWSGCAGALTGLAEDCL